MKSYWKTDVASKMYGKLFLVVYKLQSPEDLLKIIDIFKSAGMSKLLYSETSILFLNKTIDSKNGIVQVIKELSNQNFNKEDIIEIVFENNSALEFCRLKKSGNKKLILKEIKDSFQL